MGQKAQHGYQFIMHVLFRPALMVVGFLMAAIVMEVVGRFFFMTYPLAVSDAGTINGWYSILGFLVAMTVFFTTSVMIINTSVNLIHIVPDTVLSWIAPNSAAQGAGSGMSGQFAGSASVVSGAGGAMAQQSMSRVMAGKKMGSGEGDLATQIANGLKASEISKPQKSVG